MTENKRITPPTAPRPTLMRCWRTRLATPKRNKARAMMIARMSKSLPRESLLRLVELRLRFGVERLGVVVQGRRPVRVLLGERRGVAGGFGLFEPPVHGGGQLLGHQGFLDIKSSFFLAGLRCLRKLEE